MKILLGAVDRIEGIVVPDVPANGHGRFRCLYRFVNCGVGLAQTISPQHFPCGKLGIAQQQPPELDVVTIYRTFAAACGANELFQLQETLSRSLHINTALFPFALTKLAKAGDLARIDWRGVVRGSQAVAKCSLSFRPPHDP